MTVSELAAAIYGGIPEEVSKLALEPCINEILMKLAEDREVAFEFTAGTKRWFAS